ncbi:MAG: tetratricopeptide repeat protein [Phycisphaerae bacterium]
MEVAGVDAAVKTAGKPAEGSHCFTVMRGGLYAGVMRRREWALVVLLVLAAVVPFLPAVRGGFVWDDEAVHVGVVERVGNPLVFFVPGGGEAEGRVSGNYYPVSMVGFWVESRVFGKWVVGYHVVNLVLHAGNVLLVWGILRRLKVPWGFFAAFVFAVHPLGVETVAYVSELKNLLSGVFGLGAVWLWLKWGEGEAGIKKQESRRGYWVYAGVVGCFVAGMLAKSVVCVFPVVLLLVEYWRGGRVGRRVLVGVVPLFVVAGVIGGVFVWMEHTAVGARGVGFGFSVWERVVIAGRAARFYVGKFFWPTGLLTVYPKWGVDAGAWWQWGFAVGAVGVLGGLWGLRKRIGRGAFVLAAVYVVVIGPSLGLVVYFPMLFTFVADHYVYLGLIPLAVGVAGVGYWLVGRFRRAEYVVAAVVTAVLVPVTWGQAGRWRDPVALWGATVKGNGGSWYATANYAYALVQAGDNQEAARWARVSLGLKEDNSRAHFTLGLAELRLGDVAGAIGEYRRGVELEPTNAVGWANLGFALEQAGDLAGAEGAYRETLRLDEGQAKVWNEVAVLHLRGGDWAGAEGAARRAVGVSPGYGAGWVNLAIALEKEGRIGEAVGALERAAALLPGNGRVAGELARLRGMQARATGR